MRLRLPALRQTKPCTILALAHRWRARRNKLELTENQTYTENPGLLKSLSLFDWLFGIFLLTGALFALSRRGSTDLRVARLVMEAGPCIDALDCPTLTQRDRPLRRRPGDG